MLHQNTLKNRFNFLIMNQQDYFIQPLNNLLIEENLQIILHIWKNGAFLSDLQKDLKIDDSNQIKLLTTETDDLDIFYSISDTNLLRIFIHICEFSNVQYDENIFEIIKRDRGKYNQDIINNIMDKLQSKGDLKDRLHYIAVKRIISFFFLFIIENGVEFNQNKVSQDFLTNFMIESLFTNARQVVNRDPQTDYDSVLITQNKKNEKMFEKMDQEKQMIRPWGKGV